MIINELSTPVFSTTAFKLLADIARTPTAAFYLTYKEDFKRYIEKPLQAIMQREAQLLPGMMRDRLETERNVFSRFLKNDFGRGGAWANYWGAFYPRGSRRIADLQLAVWMDYRRVGISFYIGDYAAAPRQLFKRNCRRFRGDLSLILKELIGDERILRAKDGRTMVNAEGRVVAAEPLSWDAWLDDPEAGDYWAFLPLTPAEACTLRGEELAVLAAKIHSGFFPLALLAMEEEPLNWIRLFLGEGDSSF